MMIGVNKPIAALLLLLLAPILLPLRLYRWLTGTGRKSVYTSTVEGDPLAYSGDRPLVVALWASYAAIWTAATEQIVADLQVEYAGRCEFSYVEVVNRAVEGHYGITVAPTVLVRHRGREVGRFVNLLEAAELRACVAEAVSASAALQARKTGAA